jgi:hypothetical protein
MMTIRPMLALTLSAMACTSTQASTAMDAMPPAASAPAAGAPVPLRRLSEEAYASIRYNSGLTERGEQVVRDAGAWSSLWSRMTARNRATPLPPVDFGREMVLVAAMGQRPSGGHAVTIERVDDAGGELVARVVHQKPGPRCGTTSALTHPADAVLIPRSSKPVRWMVRETERDCP